MRIGITFAALALTAGFGWSSTTAATGLAAATAAPPATQKGFHVDERFGFKIKPPKNWTTIPMQIGESLLIAKFLSDKEYFWTEEGGGWTWEHRPELNVIAFIEGEDEAKVTKEKGKTTIQFVNPYKDYKAYLKGTYSGGGYYVSKEEETEIDGVKVTQLEIKVEKLTRTGPKRIVTWIFHEKQVDFAVQIEVLEDAFKKLDKTIRRTMRSFELIPRTEAGLPTRSTGSGTVIITDKDEKLTPEKRRQMRLDETRKKHAAAKESLTDGWTAKKMGRFLVINHVDDKYAKRIVEQAEAVYDWLEKHLDFIGPGEYVREPIIRICASREEESAFRKGNWWNFGAEIVTHKDQDDGALSYEQQYVRRRVMQLWMQDRDRDLYFAMPQWIDNGMSEVFEGMVVKGSNVEFRPDDWERDDLRQDVRDGKATSPKDLMRMSQDEFYGDDVWMRWKEATALVRFLIGPEGRKNKKTRTIFEDYLRNLKLVILEMEEEEKKKSGKDEDDKPRTEEEEEEYFKKKRNAWREKEKHIVDEVMVRTFGQWSDKDWAAFEKAYFKSIK